MRWSRPSPGDLIVRLLKNDGTKGTRLERYNSWWNPEGVDPNSLPKNEIT